MSAQTVVFLLLVLLLVTLLLRRAVKSSVVSAAEEQALIVKLAPTSGADAQRIHELEDRLAAAIKNASAGEFDGDEFAKDGTCTLYMYGPSAERLFEATINTLKEYRVGRGSYLIKRFGTTGAKEERVILGTGE